MTSMPAPQRRWSLDSIDWQAVPSSRGEEPGAFFYLVAAASFVEMTTDLYTNNLIDQFSGDDEITTWLKRHWLPEELQHGHALRRYVQLAWPEFEWDRAYQSFLEEFICYCDVDCLEPTRPRELVSRCVVEMGTTVFYSTLSHLSSDPVLANLAELIKNDEIRHYKHFYQYFRRYQRTEPTSRCAVLMASLDRLQMMNGADSQIAMKHLYNATHVDGCFGDGACRDLRQRSRQLIQPHFPYRLCAKMLLKPLGLGARTSRIIVPLTEAITRWIVP